MSKTLFSLSKLCYSYGETRAISEVSFSFQQGKFYTIVGPNGCGKTTLLDLLCGYRVPNSGEIQLWEKNVSHYDKKDLAKKIALVPQEFSLDLGFTVEEIVLMGRHPYLARFGAPEERDWQAVNTALENIGLENLRYHNANQLSGGQKQRTIVARALAQDTDVLLFDEATANLDIKYMLQIFNLAKELVEKKGRTIIAVLHDINLAAAYGDEMLFMRDGTIYASGKPEAVMNAKTIKTVFGVEVKVGKDLYGQAHQLSLYYGRGRKC